MARKKITRRDFIKVAGVATGAVIATNMNVLSAGASEPEAAASRPLAATTTYVKNRAPLVQTPYIPLAIGAVRAEGWLLNQLQLLKSGATGNAEGIYAELGPNSAWLGHAQSGMAPDSDWERPTYYVKGLVALAYVLNDSALITKLQKWINWAISSQQTSGTYNGAFGPSWNYFDWWPRMPMLYALKDFYEATNDSRVIPFLNRYFQFQANNLAAHPMTSWAKARIGDNIDVVLWLYNRTGDAFLLTLADTLRNQGFNFTSILANNQFSTEPHGVNVAQYMKTPAIIFQRTNSAADRDAFIAGHNHLMNNHGQVTGLPSGTEALAGRSSTQGVELCTIVERMQSNEEAQMIIGNPALGDQLEKMAFNALPGAMDKANKIHQYYSLPNHYQSVRGNTGFAQDHGTDLVPGPNSGFPCCRFNLHMGWAYYVKNMWAGTNDNGVAAMVYGPSRVTVRVGTGTVDATIIESTNYPFESQIRFTINVPSSVAFPFRLRIPAWASSPSVLVNGTVQGGVTVGTFYIINRTWNNGDTITLNVPMTIKASTQINNSIAIERGPLVFSLRMTENWLQTWTGPLGFNEYEIRPGNAWNYGLLLDRNNPGASITVQTSAMPANPFVTATTPVRLIANAKKVPWGTVQGGMRAAEVQVSPFGSPNPTEQITLIPFGAENTRMTYFPEVTAGAAPTIFEAEAATVNHATIQSNPTASGGAFVGGIDFADSYVQFNNVNAPAAGSYLFTVRYANGMGSNSTHNLSVNGGAPQTVTYPPTPGWGSGWASVTVMVNLNAGNNTLRFSLGTQFAELDYISATLGGAAPTGVTFYQNANYGGTASGLKAKGDYPSLPGDVPNDWMSSLKIPAGWTVEVFADGGFTGTKWTFTADTSWVGTDCNDKMSSFRIL